MTSTVTPRILLIELPKRGGVKVTAMMACGHKIQYLSSRATSKRDVHELVFGTQPELSMCGACKQERSGQ